MKDNLRDDDMQTADEKAALSKRRRKRRVARISLVLLLVACVCFRITLKLQIRSRLNDIREKGQPLTVEELSSYAGGKTDGPLPDAYRRAFAAYVAPDRTLNETLSRFGVNALLSRPLPEEIRASILQHVDGNTETLKHLDVAIAQTGVFYEPVNDCNDPAITLHAGFVVYDDSSMRCSARLLGFRAILKADEGNTADAANSLLSAMQVIQSAGTKPTLYTWMDRMGASSAVISILEHVVNRVDLETAQLRQITESLNSLYDPGLTTLAFMGERCLVLRGVDAHLDYLYDSSGESPAYKAFAHVITFLYRASGLRDMDEALYLKVMADAVAGAELPFAAFQKTRQSIESSWDSTSHIRVLIRNVYTGYYMRRSEFQLQARLRGAQTAVAIEHYRRSAGKLPETLAEVVPAYLDTVPSDPFDEKPIRYKKCDSGYVVYSIGEDLTDQNGISQYETKDKHDPHDWPFTVLK